ncbi:hypothetical protein BS17DRAFT_768100 [Gyrodon lividus]|nr:hypothetical protein BS17DRAFT_768100 [Gyrodon lividus]
MLDLHDDPLDKFSFMNPQEGAKEFLSALGNGAMLFKAEDSKSEDYGQEFDTISSKTNSNLDSESSGTDNNAFLQSSSLPPPLPAVKNKGKAKGTSTSKRGTTVQAHTVPYNPQTCSTSIQSEQELTLFIVRMHPMLVPPCLTSGKPSACLLKNVLVYFEDGNESADPPNTKSGYYKSFSIRIQAGVI